MTVRVEPLGVSFEVRAGETVMMAGQRAGLKWPTICGGQAQCGWCHVEVLCGQELLAPPAEKEALTLKHVVARNKGAMRLACQLRPRNDLVVRREAIRTIEGT